MTKILIIALSAIFPLFVGLLTPTLLSANQHAALAEGRKEVVRTRLIRYVQAKVIRTSYQKERSRFGNWRGRVIGDGRTHVILRFHQNGKVVGKRLIGRVNLENEPKGVFFSYRGAIPTQKHLKWDIVAFSEKA